MCSWTLGCAGTPPSYLGLWWWGTSTKCRLNTGMCGWRVLIILAMNRFLCIYLYILSEMKSVHLSAFVLHASALFSLKRMSWNLSRLSSLQTSSCRTYSGCMFFTCMHSARTQCHLGLHFNVKRTKSSQIFFIKTDTQLKRHHPRWLCADALAVASTAHLHRSKGAVGFHCTWNWPVAKAHLCTLDPVQAQLPRG